MIRLRQVVLKEIAMEVDNLPPAVHPQTRHHITATVMPAGMPVRAPVMPEDAFKICGIDECRKSMVKKDSRDRTGEEFVTIRSLPAPVCRASRLWHTKLT